MPRRGNFQWSKQKSFRFEFMQYKLFQRKLALKDSRIIIGREVHLLFQSMFVCIYKSIICALWTWYPQSGELTYAFFLSFSLIESGYAPYMYFFMNRFKLMKLSNLFFYRTLRKSIIKRMRKCFGMDFINRINISVITAW